MVETRIPAQRIDLSASSTPSLGLFPGYLWFNSASNKLFIYNGTLFREYAEQADIVTLQAQITALTGTDIAVTDNFNYSNSTDVQGVLDDIETNIYQEFLDEHNADGTHGPQVTIDQTNDASALTVDQTTAASANVINVVNSGTGDALFINQDGNGRGLCIDNDGVTISLVVTHTSAGTSANAIAVENGGTGDGLFVDQTGNGRGICVDNDGSGIGVQLTQNGANVALNIDQTSANDRATINTDELVVKEPPANTSGQLCIGTSDPIQTASIAGLCIANTASGVQGGRIELGNDNTSVTNGTVFGVVEFVGNDSGFSTTQLAGTVTCQSNTTVQGSSPNSNMNFAVSQAANGLSTVMSLHMDSPPNAYATVGQVGIGTTAPSSTAHVEITSTSTAGTELQIDYNGTGSGDVVQIFNNGSGHYVDTDAGGGTPAHLTNAGVWTNASCFRAYKDVTEEITQETAQEFLVSVTEMPLARYTDKHDRSENPRLVLGPFQDELVGQFGLSDKGVSPIEVATIALAAIKALNEKIDGLQARIDVLEG